MEKLLNPDFLLCTIPKIEKEIDMDRLFIYCTKYLSLIEIVDERNFLAVWDSMQVQKTFNHNNIDYLFVFTQNNVELVNSHLNDLDVLTGKVTAKSAESLLNDAWVVFEHHLKLDPTK